MASLTFQDLLPGLASISDKGLTYFGCTLHLSKGKAVISGRETELEALVPRKKIAQAAVACGYQVVWDFYAPHEAMVWYRSRGIVAGPDLLT